MTYRVQFAQTAEDDVRDFVDYVSNELMNPAAAEGDENAMLSRKTKSRFKDRRFSSLRRTIH